MLLLEARPVGTERYVAAILSDTLGEDRLVHFSSHCDWFVILQDECRAMIGITSARRKLRACIPPCRRRCQLSASSACYWSENARLELCGAVREDALQCFPGCDLNHHFLTLGVNVPGFYILRSAKVRTSRILEGRKGWRASCTDPDAPRGQHASSKPAPGKALSGGRRPRKQFQPLIESSSLNRLK